MATLLTFLLQVFGDTILRDLLNFGATVLKNMQDAQAQKELGAQEAVNAINADTAAKQKDMADAQTNAPGSAADLVERLRRESAAEAAAGTSTGN